MRNGGGVTVPFPVAPKAECGVKNRAAFVAAVEAASPELVPLAGLIATQPTVDPKGVASPPDPPEGARSPGGLLIDHPVIVKNGNKRFLYDGHHRLSAAVKAGKTHAVARVVDSADTEPAGLSTWAKKTG